MEATELKVMLLILMVMAVQADHSGAYSSPHYAKKMYPHGMKPIPYHEHRQEFLELPEEVSVAQDRNHYGDLSNEVVEHGGNDSSPAGRSFLSSAASFLGGRGGQVVGEIAKELIERSTGSSQVRFDCLAQVLSLNLTNLVILVILKALILAAGFFGAGAWKSGHGDHSGYGRSLHDNKNTEFVSESELLLYMSYLMGRQSEDYSCLQLTSCKSPQQALMYTSGADLLLQSAKMLQGKSVDLRKYSSIAESVRVAASWGKAGMPCEDKYKCSSQNEH